MSKNKIILSISIVMILILSAILGYIIIKNEITISNIDEEQIGNIDVAKLEDDAEQDYDIVLDLKSDLDYALDISNKDVRNENADYIIIGKVKSIDGATNYNEEKDMYTAIFTYGEIEIDTVLKGEIQETSIPFIRLGGEISFEEYEKGLSESQKEKMDLVSQLTSDEKKIKYVSYSPSGDIEIEEGKTYLIYMNYNSDYNKYMCTYLEYGVREIDTTTLNNDGQTTFSLQNETVEIKVKNNETGEWENLSDVV